MVKHSYPTIWRAMIHNHRLAILIDYLGVWHRKGGSISDHPLRGGHIATLYGCEVLCVSCGFLTIASACRRS